jgi:dihydroneopterin aldolase
LTIHIEDLTFDCIIGLLDFERKYPQSVIITLEATYDYQEQSFINYADMAKLIEKALKESAYLLLEEALLGLQSLLYKHYPTMKRLFIKISKPNILNNCKVSLSKTWNF